MSHQCRLSNTVKVQATVGEKEAQAIDKRTKNRKWLVYVIARNGQVRNSQYTGRPQTYLHIHDHDNTSNEKDKLKMQNMNTKK